MKATDSASRPATRRHTSARSRRGLMLVILVMVTIYVRKAGTEELV